MSRAGSVGAARAPRELKQAPAEEREYPVSDSASSAATRRGKRSFKVFPAPYGFSVENGANSHELTFDGDFDRAKNKFHLGLFQKRIRNMRRGSGARQHNRILHGLLNEGLINDDTAMRLFALPVDSTGEHSNKTGDLVRKYVEMGYEPESDQDLDYRIRTNTGAHMKSTVGRLMAHDPKRGRHAPARAEEQPLKRSRSRTPRVSGSETEALTQRSGYEDGIDVDDPDTWGKVSPTQARAEQASRISSRRPTPRPKRKRKR